MEPSGKKSEQHAHITRPKAEVHLLIVRNKSTHEEHLSQPLLIAKLFKIAITFLTGFNGTFKVTNEKNKLYFTKPISDGAGFTKKTVP